MVMMKEDESSVVRETGDHVGDDMPSDSDDSQEFENEKDGNEEDNNMGELDAELEDCARYSMFEKEPVETIYCHYIYLTRRPTGDEYDMRGMKTELLDFADGTTKLESSVLMSLIKNREVMGRRRYKPHRLLQYSVPLEYSEVEGLVRKPSEVQFERFMRQVEGYPDMQFEDCIMGLERHNAVYIFMVDEISSRDNRKATRRGHMAQRRIDERRRQMVLDGRRVAARSTRRSTHGV